MNGVVAVGNSEDAEHQMLRADVVVAEPERLAQRHLQGLFGLGAERHLGGPDVGPGRPDGPRHIGPHLVHAHAELTKRSGGDALPLCETDQEVLGADEAVVEAPGFVLGDDKGLTRLDQ